MTTYPSPFTQGLPPSTMAAYLKAAPTYHMSSLALGMSTHGLDPLQTHYNHGGKYCRRELTRMNEIANIKRVFKTFSEEATARTNDFFKTTAGCP